MMANHKRFIAVFRLPMMIYGAPMYGVRAIVDTRYQRDGKHEFHGLGCHKT